MQAVCQRRVSFDLSKLSISNLLPSVAVQNRGANLLGDGCFQESRPCVA